MNDIIITYDSNINSEERLKRILRCIESECEGFNEIVIVGDKPDWIQGVIHIGFNKIDNKKFLLREQYRRLKAVCLNQTITKSFIWIDADNIIPFFDARKPFRVSIPDKSENRYIPKSVEKISLEHTINLMKRRGFNYKNHYFNRFPMTMSKSRLMNTFDDIDFETAYGYCIKTLYSSFNRMKNTSEYEEPFDLTKYDFKCSYEKSEM